MAWDSQFFFKKIVLKLWHASATWTTVPPSLATIKKNNRGLKVRKKNVKYDGSSRVAKLKY